MKKVDNKKNGNKAKFKSPTPLLGGSSLVNTVEIAEAVGGRLDDAYYDKYIKQSIERGDNESAQVIAGMKNKWKNEGGSDKAPHQGTPKTVVNNPEDMKINNEPNTVSSGLTIPIQNMNKQKVQKLSEPHQGMNKMKPDAVDNRGVYSNEYSYGNKEYEGNEAAVNAITEQLYNMPEDALEKMDSEGMRKLINNSKNLTEDQQEYVWRAYQKGTLENPVKRKSSTTDPIEYAAMKNLTEKQLKKLLEKAMKKGTPSQIERIKKMLSLSE